MSKKYVSPSRNYVAICDNHNFSGVYMRRFFLPRKYPLTSNTVLENDGESAAWYFLNRLNDLACLKSIITWEDYTSLDDQDAVNCRSIVDDRTGLSAAVR